MHWLIVKCTAAAAVCRASAVMFAYGAFECADHRLCPRLRCVPCVILHALRGMQCVVLYVVRTGSNGSRGCDACRRRDGRRQARRAGAVLPHARLARQASPKLQTEHCCATQRQSRLLSQHERARLAQPSPAQPSLAARSARFCATERCRRCCEQALLCAPTCRAVGRLQTLLFMSSFSARSFDLQLEIAQLSAACVEVSAAQCSAAASHTSATD